MYIKSMKRKKMVCVTHFYAHQVLVASIFDFGIRIDNLFWRNIFELDSRRLTKLPCPAL